MSVRRRTPPVAKQRLRQAQLGDDASRAHNEVTSAIGDIEKQVGALNDLTASPETVTGSKAGNAALASLIAALAAQGLIKDGTT